MTAVANTRLSLKQIAEARKDLDKCEAVLDTFDSVESEVHANFYWVSATYYQHQHEFAKYYRTALLYLACVDLKEVTESDRQRIAYDLSIAALVSKANVSLTSSLLR